MTTPDRQQSAEPGSASVDPALVPPQNSPHPNLDAQQDRRRGRGKQILRGLGVMAVVVVIVFVVILINAGRWGVPLFPFTNEHGSKCKNNFTGHTCHPMTKEDVAHRSQIEIPAEAELVDGMWSETHDYVLNARLTYPAATAPQEWKKLGETFGPCFPDLPNALHGQPGVSEICTMTNAGIGAGGDPTPRIWSVSTGNLPDGRMAVQIDIRSR